MRSVKDDFRKKIIPSKEFEAEISNLQKYGRDISQDTTLSADAKRHIASFVYARIQDMRASFDSVTVLLGDGEVTKKGTDHYTEVLKEHLNKISIEINSEIETLKKMQFSK